MLDVFRSKTQSLTASVSNSQYDDDHRTFILASPVTAFRPGTEEVETRSGAAFNGRGSLNRGR